MHFWHDKCKAYTESDSIRLWRMEKEKKRGGKKIISHMRFYIVFGQVFFILWEKASSSLTYDGLISTWNYLIWKHIQNEKTQKKPQEMKIFMRYFQKPSKIVVFDLFKIEWYFHFAFIKDRHTRRSVHCLVHFCDHLRNIFDFNNIHERVDFINHLFFFFVSFGWCHKRNEKKRKNLSLLKFIFIFLHFCCRNNFLCCVCMKSDSTDRSLVWQRFDTRWTIPWTIFFSYIKGNFVGIFRNIIKIQRLFSILKCRRAAKPNYHRISHGRFVPKMAIGMK